MQAFGRREITAIERDMNKILSFLCVAIWILPIGNILAANDAPLTPSDSARAGRSVSDFLTPDGRFDLGAMRASGYQGPLDLKGVDVRVDPRTGAPMASTSSPQVLADDPDDIYWDNSISPSIPGVNGPVLAATVYDGKLIVGGRFTAAGSVMASCIAAWDGSSWSALGSGMNGQVRVLTTYESKLVVGGSFTKAGGKVSTYLASWSKGSCPIAMTGDANASGIVSSADIIYLVNFVLKAEPAPIPCAATGDVNCSGGVVSTSDIIYLVNSVFKGGTPPCDVCALIPGTWSCP
jgi:hypothetical protein